MLTDENIDYKCSGLSDKEIQQAFSNDDYEESHPVIYVLTSGKYIAPD